MTSAQVVEMSVSKNSSFKNYNHPDDHTIWTKNFLFHTWSELVQGVNKVAHDGSKVFQSPTTLGATSVLKIYIFEKIKQQLQGITLIAN